MKLTYKTNKLQKLCEDPSSNRELVKKYGAEVANKLPRRIKELKAFNSLNDVPPSLPYRRHKLSGDLKDCFAVNITGQYRLIFRQKENNIITEDLREIKEIEIMEVSKHYE